MEKQESSKWNLYLFMTPFLALGGYKNQPALEGAGWIEIAHAVCTGLAGMLFAIALFGSIAIVLNRVIRMIVSVFGARVSKWRWKTFVFIPLVFAVPPTAASAALYTQIDPERIALMNAEREKRNAEERAERLEADRRAAKRKAYKGIDENGNGVLKKGSIVCRSPNLAEREWRKSIDGYKGKIGSGCFSTTRDLSVRVFGTPCYGGLSGRLSKTCQFELPIEPGEVWYSKGHLFDAR